MTGERKAPPPRGADMAQPADVTARCTRPACGFKVEATSWQEAKNELDAHCCGAGDGH